MRFDTPCENNRALLHVDVLSLVMSRSWNFGGCRDLVATPRPAIVGALHMCGINLWVGGEEGGMVTC